MASTSEIILPIGTQKHDPAWKHCLMVRGAGRTKLRCVYCMKQFLGGGIHRIKEHLARHKGNASCCPKVPLEVQVAMQQSLEGSAARRKKKLKLAEEVSKPDPIQADGGDVDSGLQLIQLPEMVDTGAVQVEVKEEGVVPKLPERGRKKRARYTSPPLLPPPLCLQTLPPMSSDAGKLCIEGTISKDQVCMAIGRFLYEAGVPLEAVNCASFQPMVDAIASAGPGLGMLSYHDFREPLLQVYKLVESNKKPAMGYIHVAMYQVKQAIRKELLKKADYMIYWEIIDWKWNRQLPCPLYSAAFFLNPRFFFSIQGDVCNEISSGVLDCIERLIPEANIQDKIQKELSLYKSSSGDFGRKMAIRARNTLLPAEWWSTYGGACPNLMRLAIRILSQTCSARGCERVQLPFEQIHNHRMNYLEHQRLCDLIFVHYNLQLQQRKILRHKTFDPISVENIDVVGDWIVEKNDLLSADADHSNWMTLNQPVATQLQSEYINDEETETFLAGIDDDVIQAAGKNVEDDGDIKEEDEVQEDTAFT
ncbi:hypothetical protein OPV22_031191 [Ensete ventricosum]|uniref:BED-type domain-containing protein n=1 Tax=Ensete ventricosum TaxID=4639 RepID=A0AAV8PTW1_ENSVE|nr:hypothetical protein OPV22_031191 [Ensete ventricosum]